MVDTLVSSEILGIWGRIKNYVDLDKIKSVDALNQKEELRRAMQSPTRKSGAYSGNMNTLIEKGFPGAFVENETIREELLGEKLREITVKGTTRYQIEKGTPTYSSITGAEIRAGQFVGGTSKTEAVKSLKDKLEGD